MLQHGDDDARQIWGGRRRGASETHPAAGETGFVEEAAGRPGELGFTLIGNPDGSFGRHTEWALREFQHVADSRWLAQEAAPSAAPPARYVDRLTQVQTPPSLLTPLNVSGWLSANDAARIDLSAREPLALPTGRGGLADGRPRRQQPAAAGPAAAEENIWIDTSRPGRSGASWPATSRSARPRATGANDAHRVLGYKETTSKGGPQSIPPNHVWREAEITPVSMTGRAIGSLTAEELSTFKVVRAFPETECEGYLDSINCWDDVILSAGPCHWPIGRPAGPLRSRGGGGRGTGRLPRISEEVLLERVPPADGRRDPGQEVLGPG